MLGEKVVVKIANHLFLALFVSLFPWAGFLTLEFPLTDPRPAPPRDEDWDDPNEPTRGVIINFLKSSLVIRMDLFSIHKYVNNKNYV